MQGVDRCADKGRWLVQSRVLAPGTMGGLVPFLLTGWTTHHPPLVVLVVGALLLAAGGAVLLHAFTRFVTEGVGTPAPAAPTERSAWLSAACTATSATRCTSRSRPRSGSSGTNTRCTVPPFPVGGRGATPGAASH